MEWTTIITSLIAAVLGGGGIGTLFYYRETKRDKQAKTDLSLAEGWKVYADAKQEVIEKMNSQIEAKDRKIEDLYSENGQLRDENDKLSTECAVLKIYKCINIDCDKRKPPFGYSVEFDAETVKAGCGCEQKKDINFTKNG